jgi:hypothetical protein
MSKPTPWVLHWMEFAHWQAIAGQGQCAGAVAGKPRIVACSVGVLATAFSSAPE